VSHEKRPRLWSENRPGEWCEVIKEKLQLRDDAHAMPCVIVERNKCLSRHLVAAEDT
jgi:hypothetical protein